MNHIHRKKLIAWLQGMINEGHTRGKNVPPDMLAGLLMGAVWAWCYDPADIGEEIEQILKGLKYHD